MGFDWASFSLFASFLFPCSLVISLNLSFPSPSPSLSFSLPLHGETVHPPRQLLVSQDQVGQWKKWLCLVGVHACSCALSLLTLIISVLTLSCTKGSQHQCRLHEIYIYWWRCHLLSGSPVRSLRADDESSFCGIYESNYSPIMTLWTKTEQ